MIPSHITKHIVLFVGVWLCLLNAQQSGQPTPNETQSYWLLNAPFQNTTTGTLPSMVDITIIGSGISGSSVSYYLSEYLNGNNNSNNKSTSVLLLDARGASGGASGRNAGALHVITDTAFQSTLNKYGNETAIKYYNFTVDTAMEVLNLLNPKTVQSGVRSETFISVSDISKRNNSINLMQSFGYGLTEELIPNAHEIDNKLNSYSNSSFVGGVYGPFAYSLNPADVVFKLINKTILNTNNSFHIDNENKMNLNIQYKTLVNSVKYDSNNLYYNINVTQLQLQNNMHKNPKIIQSKTIVFATNAYSTYLLPQFTGLILSDKNQVIISKAYNSNSLIWNQNITGIMSVINNPNIINSGVRYYGQYQHFDNRILILGDPINESWIGNYNDSYIDINFTNTMQQFLIDNYPEISRMNGIEIDMQWSGILTKTKDGYPYIGPIVNMTNCYICAGFGGLGLSQALNAGKAIASMIVGETPDPFLDIFLPNGRM